MFTCASAQTKIAYERAGQCQYKLSWCLCRETVGCVCVCAYAAAAVLLSLGEKESQHRVGHRARLTAESGPPENSHVTWNKMMISFKSVYVHTLGALSGTLGVRARAFLHYKAAEVQHICKQADSFSLWNDYFNNVDVAAVVAVRGPHAAQKHTRTQPKTFSSFAARWERITLTVGPWARQISLFSLSLHAKWAVIIHITQNLPHFACQIFGESLEILILGEACNYLWLRFFCAKPHLCL